MVFTIPENRDAEKYNGGMLNSIFSDGFSWTERHFSE